MLKLNAFIRYLLTIKAKSISKITFLSAFSKNIVAILRESPNEKACRFKRCRLSGYNLSG
ncbi:hypothetical protein [Adhaeribacter soli]|uniref:Uncharacterized protein n=1 Tax=Adhaeribacter soli TaxID=2607655 RepID=A0A5N1IPS1_9BACT|nr:hypothetical protein [Adhaeribacter soli]KAA9331768.1 hypothetical protein F0P94_13230 [Adhaeribacter soli]